MMLISIILKALQILIISTISMWVLYTSYKHKPEAGRLHLIISMNFQYPTWHTWSLIYNSHWPKLQLGVFSTSSNMFPQSESGYQKMKYILLAVIYAKVVLSYFLSSIPRAEMGIQCLELHSVFITKLSLSLTEVFYYSFIFLPSSATNGWWTQACLWYKLQKDNLHPLMGAKILEVKIWTSN